MNSETLRDVIRENFECRDYLEKSKGRDMYCCPFCDSGHGPNGTGALKFYAKNKNWTCHKCGKSGDVIDLYMKKFSLSFVDAIREMGAKLGYELDAANGGHVDACPPPTPPYDGEVEQKDFKQYFKTCAERLEAARNYIESRGIRFDTAAQYGIGFDPNYRGSGIGRVIVPSNSQHYIARAIVKADRKVLNPAGVPSGIFNANAITESRVVFVTEGVFDALSIIDNGQSAIALNSTSNTGILVRQLEANLEKVRDLDLTLILCLDNDDAGKKATERLIPELDRLKVAWFKADVTGDHKDPNEFLQADPNAFAKAVQKAAKAAENRPDDVARYVETDMAADRKKLKDVVKTGFKTIDRLTGGLYPGLYVLGAISSLGKTTFSLQMAEQIAKEGHDVIFFSLEQSRFELVSKGIARRTAGPVGRNKNALTSLQIRRGVYKNDDESFAEEVARVNYVKELGGHFSIVEGNFECDFNFVKSYIGRHIQRTRTRPVVFLDYLQVLQPPEGTKWKSAKEGIDSVVTELKRLSSKYNIPMFVISSVNRANYLTPFSFESLKESGGIEFTADVVLGLQLQCLREPLFTDEKNIVARRQRVKECKEADPRKIELTCLKNRYGHGFSVFFDYIPKFDMFMDCGEPEDD